MTICNADHCPNRAIRRGRCDQHAREQAKAKAQRRGYSAHAAGYDARWGRTRKRILRAHPVCQRCTHAPSIDVHHIEGGPKDLRGHDEANLEALCHACHARETRARQHG